MGKYLSVAKSELSILSNSIVIVNSEKQACLDVNSLYAKICIEDCDAYSWSNECHPKVFLPEC